ncbi:MAG: alpha-L-arabinofuranosidase C-terminal domain-containing protein, partial [bacterium]
IRAGDAETGLQQKPFCVERSETYGGSLWACGDGTLLVRLLDGETVLAQASGGPVDGEWREFAFQLDPAADAENATLQVGVQPGGDVRIDQVSMMPDSWRAAGGFRPDLVQAIKDLKPPVIRWPGGCFASAYRWKQGIGPQHKREVHPLEIWDQKDVYSMGTDEFIRLCRMVGAEPIIVVNIGTPQWGGPGREKEFDQEVLDWIEYCNGPKDSKWGKVRAENGHPEPYNVKYWEIDNEVWRMGGGNYANRVNHLAPLMRKTDPSIKLIACGSGGYGEGGTGFAFNRAVIEGCADQVDYLSIHHYEAPNRFADGPGIYETFIRRTHELIKKSKNPDLKIYCSEWNAQSTDWRTGLYCGGLLNAFERCGDYFTIGGPALFLRHVSATAWDNAFINFDHRTWFPAPNYVVMKLWREHYQPERIGLEGETGPLNIVATKSENGKTACLKVVNPSDELITLRLAMDSPFEIGGATAEQVAPAALHSRNTLEDPHAVQSKPINVSVEGRQVSVVLPAYSATVVNVGG